jgi:hypothetical protein
MSIPAWLKPENGPVGRGLGAWLDHVPSGLATRFVLVWFVILYTAFAIISSGAQGLDPALLETYALGQNPAAGYAGYPPLAPWIAGAWFRLFPPTDWAFHLLAMANAAVGLFAADRIAGLYLDGDKRIVALLILLLTPIYTFAGQGFGANETMLSTWPVATWCFLRASATRSPAWSVAAGVAGAFAVLGSYQSAFLVAAFALAVLAHPARGAFLRTAAPWLALAAGAIVLAPHAAWLMDMLSRPAPVFMFEGAPPADTMPSIDRMTIIVQQFAAATPAPVWDAAPYILGLGIILAICFAAMRSGRAAQLRAFVQPAPDGRTLLILLIAPLVLPLLALPWVRLPWPQAAWFLAPVILLRPQEAELSRTAAIRITALAALAAVGALAVAPWLAWQRHEGGADIREYERLVGAEVTNAWRRTTGEPLRIVMGDARLTAATAFYSPDHPDAVAGFGVGATTPSVTPERLAADGFATVCRTDDEACVSAAKQRAAGKANVQFITYSTTNRYLGKPGPLGRFFFILVPSQTKPVIMLPQERSP